MQNIHVASFTLLNIFDNPLYTFSAITMITFKQCRMVHVHLIINMEQIFCACSGTVKIVLKDHCHETTCLGGPLVSGRRFYISM